MHRARIGRPVPGAATLDRPELVAQLADAAVGRRLTLVVAGAGFGKTTLLATFAGTRRAAWYTLDATDADPGLLAAGLAAAVREILPQFRSDLEDVARGPAPAAEVESFERATGLALRLVDELEPSLTEDLVLVVDDAHALGDALAAWRLVETIVRVAPPGLHLVIGSRVAPPFAIERLRGQGEVEVLGESDLAFRASEIERVLGPVLQSAADPGALASLAERIHGLTAGWPAAVRLAAETLRGAEPDAWDHELDRLHARGGALFSYLAEELVAHAAAPVRGLIQRMWRFDRFSAPLCEAVGVVDAEQALAGLAQRALFLQPVSGAPGWYELHPLIRDFARSELPMARDEVAELHRRAAAWFLKAGQREAAIRSLVASGDPGPLAIILRRVGADLVAGGGAREVVAAAGTLPDHARDEQILLLLGEANLALGDWPAAIAALRQAAGARERPSAAVAWRLGLIQGLRGAYDEALAIYRQADLSDAAPEDEAFLHAFTTSAQRHRGEADAAAASAARALDAANRSGRPRALAAALAAVGQAREMGNDLPAALDAFERALAAAEQAGDVIQRVRVLTSIGSIQIELGRFQAARATLDEAVELSRAIGFAAFQARALAERGRARWWSGHMEEGLADMTAGRELYTRMDAPGRVFALLNEGELHLFRGDVGAARALLERAVEAGRESTDSLLGLCLAELAEAVGPEDPERAAALLAEAVELGRRLRNAQTLSASGYAHLTRGDRDLAMQLALETEAIALRSGEAPMVALAREIQGRVAGDTPKARELFESALAIWRDVGAPFGVALNRLELARTCTGPDAVAAAAEAVRSLQAYGARALAAEAATVLADLEQAKRPEVSITTLGGFVVRRSGQAVASGEWRSKKARDLLKILAARRGRPVPREQLFELLWPEEDPEPLANRLSVALATVRSILDPERRHESDWFVGADRGAIWLEVDRVELDVVRFLADVAEGRRLQRAGRDVEALAAFERAEAAYLGPFLEEDPYEDYAANVRDEAQSAYAEAARHVARQAIANGDPDTAIRIQLRILEHDAFDERAHVGLVRALVAAGRHGEARRRYGVFAARMAEIGVEAAPFPAPEASATVA